MMREKTLGDVPRLLNRGLVWGAIAAAVVSVVTFNAALSIAKKNESVRGGERDVSAPAELTGPHPQFLTGDQERAQAQISAANRRQEDSATFSIPDPRLQKPMTMEEILARGAQHN